MDNDGFVEVWFMWNDGRKTKGALENTMPEFYIGKHVGLKREQRFKFCDLTNNPHLPEIKAMADLMGECEQSRGRGNSIPWSDTFLIPTEWAIEWWGDPRGGVNHG